MGLRIFRRGIDNQGFSFVELIIAIGVLSCGIIVVLQAVSFSARAEGLSADITSAVFLAQDKMQGLELDEKMKVLEEKSGQETIDKYNEEYSVKSIEDSKIYEAKIDISWLRYGVLKTINVDTYFANEKE